MVKWAIPILVLLCVPTSSKVASPQEIFAQNKDAVVRIFVNNGELSGCGFIVSEDGLVVTANHVITSKKDGFKEPATDIKVERPGDKQSHFAKVVSHDPASDSAVLSIVASGLPHANIGNFSSVQIADPVSIITFFKDSKIELLLTGIASGVGLVPGGNPSQPEGIIFQIPTIKGFSGSPIFDQKGLVIGIVNTRLIGISPDLDGARDRLNASKQNGSVLQISNVSFQDVTLGLINSLDVNLVSGLGSAVSISYAEKMIEQADTKRQR